MTAPVEITFRSMDPSPAVADRISKWASRLELACDRIEHCEVVVETPHRRHRTGKTFQIHITVSIPEHTIEISRSSDDPTHENVYVAIADAFRAARRQLREYVRSRRDGVRASA